MHPHGYWWYVCGTDRNCNGTGNTYIDIAKKGGFLSLPAGYRINLSLGSLFHGFQLIKPGLNSELCPPPGTIALPGQSASDQTDFEISSHNVNIMFPQSQCFHNHNVSMTIMFAQPQCSHNHDVFTTTMFSQPQCFHNHNVFTTIMFSQP